ncbi:MAG: hypothetical protein WDO56_18625 [Gammaproteobacteria bacterium]
MSIPADDPGRVASVIAEIWRTEAFPFVFPGSFIVIPDDERGTEIEVVKRGDEQVPAAVEVGLRVNPGPSPYSEVHVNMVARIGEADVLALAAREGWIARVCDRRFFKLIELWVENRFLLELLTEAEAARYRSFMSKAGWRAVLASEPMPLERFGFATSWLRFPADTSG